MESKQKEMFSIGDFVVIHKRVYQIKRVFTQEKSYRVESMFRRRKGEWRVFYPCHDEITGKFERKC